MAENFTSGNLLACVSQKLFPNGVTKDVMNRLDGMTVFRQASPRNLDSFRGLQKMQTQAIKIFNETNNGDISSLTDACTNSGIKIKVDSVETAYVADAEETGSLSVYTFTDARGNKVSITDINVKDALKEEQTAFDDELSGLIGEIESGAVKLPASPYEAELAA